MRFIAILVAASVCSLLGAGCLSNRSVAGPTSDQDPESAPPVAPKEVFRGTFKFDPSGTDPPKTFKVDSGNWKLSAIGYLNVTAVGAYVATGGDPRSGPVVKVSQQAAGSSGNGTAPTIATLVTLTFMREASAATAPSSVQTKTGTGTAEGPASLRVVVEGSGSNTQLQIVITRSPA